MARTSWNVYEFVSFMANTLLSNEVTIYMDREYGVHASVIEVKGDTLGVSLSNGDDFRLVVRKENNND